MIELTILVLLHRLMGWGRDPAIAARIIAADAVSLRRLVSDPALGTVAAMAHDAAEDLDRQALPWARASLRAQRTRAARGRRRWARTTVHHRGS